MNFQEFLSNQFLGNYIRDYFWALAAFFGILILLRIFKSQIVKRLKKLAEKTKTQLDDLLVKILDSAGWPTFYLLLSLYLALKFIQSPQILDNIIYYALIIIITYLAVKTGGDIIDYGTLKIIQKKEKGKEKIDRSMVDILSKGLKAILWVVAVVLVLSNLGYNVSTLIAGLGIGGIAIAFALQNILGDLFASFTIYFDRPFQIGDYIIIGDDAGTVKHIGIKSTRIQSRQGEELIISNKELTEARVHNYKKMEKRRIVFAFGVTYETPTQKLKKIPNIIKEIVDKIETAEIDRVFFKEFGDFGLNFEVVYFLKSSDYALFVETQPKINLAIKEAFEKEGIEMAYPTQTVFVKRQE